MSTNKKQMLEMKLKTLVKRILKEENNSREIENALLNLFAHAGMDKPDNFDNILEFVIQDVEETADPVNWSDGDVAIAFRRWVESKG